MDFGEVSFLGEYIENNKRITPYTGPIKGAGFGIHLLLCNDVDCRHQNDFFLAYCSTHLNHYSVYRLTQHAADINISLTETYYSMLRSCRSLVTINIGIAM
jgi:hypothetical protein